MSTRPPANTIAELLNDFREPLRARHGAAGMQAIFRTLLRERLGLAVPELEQHRALEEREAALLQEALHRICAGEPLQYVLGSVDFHGVRLAVDPRALIPRPETEELVDRIIRAAGPSPGRILDIGTGSGCIALALKKAFPQAAVTGADVSLPALELARANARANGLDVAFVECDALGAGLPLLLAAEALPGSTLLVSNPPYVPLSDKASMEMQVLRHEPHLALFVPDGDPHRFYRAIAHAAAPVFVPGDRLWLEVHYLHAPETAAIVKGAGFGQVELLQDLSGNQRFIQARR